MTLAVSVLQTENKSIFNDIINYLCDYNYFWKRNIYKIRFFFVSTVMGCNTPTGILSKIDF